MSKSFKPMLAADISDQLDKLRFPVIATPKLDGVRALITKEGVFSRSLKKIPHRITQGAFREPELIGFDGELIVGSPTAADCYRHTQSVVATADSPEIATFYVFDLFDSREDYDDRMVEVASRMWEVDNFYVKIVPMVRCVDREQLEQYEACFLAEGYEGLILRQPAGDYKFGRSTVNEQGMLKLKRFKDGEAEIIGMEEELRNDNEAKTNALGHTERSSHKENLVGKGSMGALNVRDCATGVEFRIGTGFTAADRHMFWLDRARRVGRVVKYKYFPVGVKDKPRHPTYQGMREGWDR